MGAPYAIPNFTTSSGMIQYADVVSGGILLNLLMIAMFLIIFLILKQRYELPTCFMGGSFLVFILSTILWGTGLIMGTIPIMFMVFTAIGVLWKMFTD